MNIGILVTKRHFDINSKDSEKNMASSEFALLKEAFENNGINCEKVFWEKQNNFSDFDIIMPLLAWEYHENINQFLSCLECAHNHGVKIINPIDIIKDNFDKNYLTRLYEKGAKVPPTIEINGQDKEAIIEAFDRLDANEIVIKPKIGAGAWRQVRLKKDEPTPSKNLLPPNMALVQPFIESVAKFGELSMIYFAGKFSHAVQKTPKSGDYRTQTKYGAIEKAFTPDDEAIKTANEILAIYDNNKELGYARIDLVRYNNQWFLMEMELIEPYLYLEKDGQNGKVAANNFAKAIKLAVQ